MADQRFTDAATWYERIWDFVSAHRAAAAAGDLPRALRCALESRQEALIASATEALVSAAGPSAAVDIMVAARRHLQAAILAERAGQLVIAAEQYKRGHSDLDAARILEALGEDRKAGQLLERFVDVASANDRPAAALALGRILLRRAAYPAAAKWLQEAAKHQPHAKEALGHLVYCLAAMGLRDGANDTLLALNRLDEVPAVAHVHPVDLDAFLRERRASMPAPGKADRETLGGRFVLQKQVGAGASGRVFVATDAMTGQQVAVKMFFAASAKGSEAYERFVREAKIAAGIRHPSLVEIYDASLEHGYLVMEYMPGGSLHERLRADGTMPAPAVRRMALELCDALHAVHHRGVVHRDIKAANIFFDARGTAKLGDFGVAHLADLGQTQTGGMIGTLAYMSPEQITGAPITVVADLYSLGITLFEALTGRLPFLGPDFVAQHLGETPPLPSTIAEHSIDPIWDHIVTSLLAKNPAERLATVAQLATLLRQTDGSGAAVLIRPAAASSSTTMHTTDFVANNEPVSRYQFETQFAATPISDLSRAVDVVLGRTVIIERFHAHAATDALQRVTKLARTASPFVQRVLSVDVPTCSVIFEAPAGVAIPEVREAVDAAVRARVLKRLARGLAAIAESGAVHGALSAATVVLDELLSPVIVISGTSARVDQTAHQDLTATVNAVLALPGEHQFATQDLMAAQDAESLYALGDREEIAVLSARFRQQ
jgi:eukaryotic-like serine/threonine-protein kinase